MLDSVTNICMADCSHSALTLSAGAGAMQFHVWEETRWQGVELSSAAVLSAATPQQRGRGVRLTSASDPELVQALKRKAEASGLTDVSAIKRHLVTWKREIKEASKDMVWGTLVAACARVSCSNGQEPQQTGKSTGEDIQSISVLPWGVRLW